MRNKLPETTYIDTFIEEGKENTLSIRNFYDSMLVGNSDRPDHIIRIPISDFFVKHRDHLVDLIQIYTIGESMYYKPKTLSLQLYGTTELWLSILRLNEMKNVTEFHLPIIKIYDPNRIKDMINIFFKRENTIS